MVLLLLLLLALPRCLSGGVRHARVGQCHGCVVSGCLVLGGGLEADGLWGRKAGGGGEAGVRVGPSEPGASTLGAVGLEVKRGALVSAAIRADYVPLRTRKTCEAPSAR